MAGVALLHSVPEEGAFLLEALRASGYRADLVNDPAAADAVVGADVILADLDIAIAAGWVRPTSGAKPPRLPLIVSSPHDAFLDVVRRSVAATLRTPASREEVAAAVERARSGEREPSRPSKETNDPTDRDAELARRGMTSDRVDPELLGIAALVARGVGASMALITVVDSKRQIFVGHSGLPIDLAIAAGTVRDWSFCQHAVTAKTALVVSDASAHPFFAHTPLVETNIVRSYAGAPIEIDGLGAIGTVCVLSAQPRDFISKDLATLELAAKLAAARLERRGPAFDAQRPPRFDDDGSLHVGDLVGDKYWITASLGRGGQSEVFLARDRLSGQLVAIKSMRDRDEQVLVHEAEALTRLRHPNIVQLHGWGRSPHEELYLVLEYVEGVTLAERIAAAHRGGQPLSLAFVAETIRPLAGALASMHAIGYVHGDVKPSNVICDRALDRAVLIDFGFPLAVGTVGSGSGERSSTSSPIVGGTPGFSSPEQFVASGSPSSATAALDVYSLAALAYAMIAGEGPFAEIRGRERVAAQLAGRFPAVSSKRRGVPVEIDELLARALAPDPEKRPSSVLDFADDLEQLIAYSQPIVRTADTADAPRPARSRGLAFRVYRAEIRRREGEEGEAAIFAQLSPADRAVFDSVDDDELHYPADALVAYLRAYGRGDEERLSALGFELAALALPDALKAMHVTRTPETLLYAASSLLHRFHDWGRIEIERPAPGVAHVVMHLPEGFAPVMCHYFVGMERALLAMTGRTSSVQHDQCVAKGANVCRFLVTWSSR